MLKITQKYYDGNKLDESSVQETSSTEIRNLLS